MEKQRLQYAIPVLILAILSLIGCCCTSGFGGLVLSGIALFLANKDMKKYKEDPESYSNYSMLNAGRIIAIIGLVLSVIIVGLWVYAKATGADAIWQEQLLELQERLQQAQ